MNVSMPKWGKHCTVGAKHCATKLPLLKVVDLFVPESTANHLEIEMDTGIKSTKKHDNLLIVHTLYTSILLIDLILIHICQQRSVIEQCYFKACWVVTHDFE